jgi:hypothetical protein
MKQDDYIIEAHFIRDSFIDGQAKYYDKNGNVVSLVDYKKGIKNGPAVNFYDNGIKKDSMNYTNGLLNGELWEYDSLGHLEKVVTYYYGLLVGHSTTYYFNQPHEYYYNDLNGDIIFYCEYDSLGKCLVGKFEPRPRLDRILDDNRKPALRLFLYFIKPPNLSTTYSLGIATEKNETIQEYQIKTDRLFFDTVLQSLPKNEHYFISTHIENKKDSINQVFINQLKWE